MSGSGDRATKWVQQHECGRGDGGEKGTHTWTDMMTDSPTHSFAPSLARMATMGTEMSSSPSSPPVAAGYAMLFHCSLRFGRRFECHMRDGPAGVSRAAE